jgi:hypothetical protein
MLLLGAVPGALFSQVESASGVRVEESVSDEKRTFSNGVFISESLPDIAIRLPEAFAYLGRTAFALEEKARVDRHHFLDASPDGAVRRIAILHFESLLPAADGRINYRPPDPPDHAGPNYRFTLVPVRLGAHAYIHNTWFFGADEEIQSHPDKELARTARLLARHGYPFPGEIQMSRYLRLIGVARRSELILFYQEPLAATGFELADFVEGGPGAAEFDRLSAELTARSEKVFAVERG